MYFSICYIITGSLILAAILISLFAEIKVYSNYNKYKEERSPLDMTGSELANKLAYDNNIGIKVVKCKGNLTDHYNPIDKTLNLSESNYDGRSIAAHAIVAHEFGHAMQDAEEYAPLKVRQIAIKMSRYSSVMLLPLIIIAILFELFFLNQFYGDIILYVIAGVYFLAVVVNLITVPVEYNASHRAKKLLETQMGISKENMVGVSKVLNAAALTYLASLLISVLYLLRIFLLIYARKR